jgi:uroporphyrinogen-III synthase
MSVASFDDACSGRMPQVTEGSLVAAIGRPTADALTSRGIGVDIVPSKADFKLLLETVYNTLEVKE